MRTYSLRTESASFLRGIDSRFATALLSILLVLTWALLHHYVALDLDGQLYAFQAMAKLNPNLGRDLFLGGTSQDEFSLFSPLYALVIHFLGLLNAGLVLFVLCAVTFFIATWSVARSLWGKNRAWLATGMVVTTVGAYGAWHVFNYSESYLTARSMAEALVIVSLSCRFKGLERLSWGVAAAAMLIHPIMAFPGLLLLICLSVPLVYSSMGAVAGVLISLLVALLASNYNLGSHAFQVITGDWLEVVRERSQFLFLQDWSWDDWDFHARVLLSLWLAALVADERVRRLCIGAALLGTSGLLVALVASSVGPVAILLQGQAWRWFWLASFVSALVLLPAAIRLWSEGGCGSVCATLLVSSWTFPAVNGTYLAAAALALWYVRGHVRPPTDKLLKSAAFILIVVVAGWTIANIWSVCTSPPVARAGEILLIERLRSVFALQIPALALVSLTLLWIRSGLSYWGFAAATGALTILGFLALAGSVRLDGPMGSRTEIEALSPWRDTIPPTSTVLVVPEQRASSFVWFSLQRPSYLTVSQSAGVVFSRVTALEIRRRAEVLLPVMDPDYKLRTLIAKRQKSHSTKDDTSQRPLTRERLLAICSDPPLDFVVAKESLGFGAVRSEAPGRWKDWNLYDCRRVRPESTP